MKEVYCSGFALRRYGIGSTASQFESLFFEGVGGVDSVSTCGVHGFSYGDVGWSCDNLEVPSCQGTIEHAWPQSEVAPFPLVFIRHCPSRLATLPIFLKFHKFPIVSNMRNIVEYMFYNTSIILWNIGCFCCKCDGKIGNIHCQILLFCLNIPWKIIVILFA